MKVIAYADYRVLKRFWNKRFMRIPLFVCSKWYIIVSWCIWELTEDVLQSIWTRPSLFSYCTRIGMVRSLKMAKVKLDLLTNINMFLMVEKTIRGEICHAIHQYVNTSKTLTIIYFLCLKEWKLKKIKNS